MPPSEKLKNSRVLRPWACASASPTTGPPPDTETTPSLVTYPSSPASPPNWNVTGGPAPAGRAALSAAAVPAADAARAQRHEAQRQRPPRLPARHADLRRRSVVDPADARDPDSIAHRRWLRHPIWVRAGGIQCARH